MTANPLPAPPAVLAAASSAIAPTPIPPDATEEQLIGLWLHGKSPNTIRAYRRDIAAFRAFIGKPIRLGYLGDLQRYADALVGSPASCARRLLVVKSLLSFAVVGIELAGDARLGGCRSWLIFEYLSNSAHRGR